MRAPQYGHNKSKKRGRLNDLKPSLQPVQCKSRDGRAITKMVLVHHALPAPFVAPVQPGRGMWHAVGLRGGNEPLPSRPIHYITPKTALYEDGTYGAPCTMSLHHKSATWVEGVKTAGEGPTATKRYSVAKSRHRR